MEKVVLFDEKYNCCGCTACATVCPRAAISMQSDEEGFLYPVINEDICVHCLLCVNACPLR